MAKTHRLIKASTGAALSLALVLLSPGLECYAGASASLNTPVSDAGSPTTGKTGGSGISLIQFTPGSIQLSPASLSGSIKAMPAVPAVRTSVRPTPAELPIPQVAVAAKTAPAAIPSAIPQAAAPQTSLIALTATPASLSAPIRQAAPQAAQTVSAQLVLQTGVSQIDQAKDPAGRAQVLDAVFTGSKAKTDPADIAVAAASDQTFASGLKPAAPEPTRAVTVPQAEAAPALAKTKIYITRADLAPVVTTLAELPQTLAADPALKDSLNRLGRVRLILAKDAPNGSLTDADAARVSESLRRLGVTAKFEVEKISVDWKPAPKPVEAVPALTTEQQKTQVVRSRLWRYLVGPVTWPFRQLAYLGKTLHNAYTAPTATELIGGVVSKIVPVVMTIGVWGTMYTGHPLALAAALTVSIGLNVFHGLWINTWSNFQNKLGKEKGLNYEEFIEGLKHKGQWHVEVY